MDSNECDMSRIPGVHALPGHQEMENYYIGKRFHVIRSDLLEMGYED